MERTAIYVNNFQERAFRARRSVKVAPVPAKLIGARWW